MVEQAANGEQAGAHHLITVRQDLGEDCENISGLDGLLPDAQATCPTAVLPCCRRCKPKGRALSASQRTRCNAVAQPAAPGPQQASLARRAVTALHDPELLALSRCRTEWTTRRCVCGHHVLRGPLRQRWTPRPDPVARWSPSDPQATEGTRPPLESQRTLGRCRGFLKQWSRILALQRRQTWHKVQVPPGPRKHDAGRGPES